MEVTDTDNGHNPSPTLSLEDLPSSLLLHILTLLSPVDAVSTSLISRRFRRLWPELPSLNISYDNFPLYSSPVVTLRHFSHFVDQLLLLRHRSSSLSYFILEFPYEPYLRSTVDAWVQHAIRSKVRHLSLHFGSHDVVLPIYDFPFFFLRGGCVESLRFSYCDLNLDCSPLVLCSIKLIDFSHLYLTDKMVVNLFEFCPNLEWFRLNSVCGVVNLVISSLNVKFLELGFLALAENGLSVELNCPALLELNILQLEVDKFDVKDLTSLVKLCICFYHDEAKCFGFWSQISKMLDRCPKIRHFESPSWWFKLQPINAFPEGFMFFNLKSMVIPTNYRTSDLLGLAEILELSPNLIALTLIRTGDTDKDDNEVERFSHLPIHFSIPNLQEIKMERFCGFKTECDFLLSVKSQGAVLEKITIAYLDENMSTTTFKRRSTTFAPFQEVLPS